VPRERWEGEAQRLADAGLGVWHWDHSDGTIGPAGGFDPADAARLTADTGCRAEAHLMALDPRPLIAEWAAFCELIVVHSESPFASESVRLIRSHGVRAAIAVSADTGDGFLSTGDVPGSVDGVLVMSVAPGHAGAAFRETAINRIAGVAASATALFPRGPRPLVGIDGSVTPERAHRAAAAGADWIVSGTSLVSASDPAAWLREVR
jgi:ribulose-phosphate 3-epimerase